MRGARVHICVALLGLIFSTAGAVRFKGSGGPTDKKQEYLSVRLELDASYTECPPSQQLATIRDDFVIRTMQQLMARRVIQGKAKAAILECHTDEEQYGSSKVVAVSFAVALATSKFRTARHRLVEQLLAASKEGNNICTHVDGVDCGAAKVALIEVYEMEAVPVGVKLHAAAHKRHSRSSHGARQPRGHAAAAGSGHSHTTRKGHHGGTSAGTTAGGSADDAHAKHGSAASPGASSQADSSSTAAGGPGESPAAGHASDPAASSGDEYASSSGAAAPPTAASAAAGGTASSPSKQAGAGVGTAAPAAATAAGAAAEPQDVQGAASEGEEDDDDAEQEGDQGAVFTGYAVWSRKVTTKVASRARTAAVKRAVTALLTGTKSAGEFKQPAAAH